MLTASNVTKTIVGDVHRHQLSQYREVDQARQRRVIDELATHSQAFQRRHPRQRHKPATFEVRTLTPPEVFNCFRSTERFEALISSDGALAHQHAKLRKRTNVSHRVVVAELILTAKVNQIC